MPVYDVAEMRYDRVMRSKAVEASNPAAAAEAMTGRGSASQKWGKEWIRVIDADGGRVFAYTIARRSMMADDKNREPLMVMGSARCQAWGAGKGNGL
ncbi:MULTISPECIES: hypothetical protein [Mesorhizobium]|uniref:Uncharacterized protein n=1 Tax=Rhizobium loti TaxID=381 RepID=A0AA91F949_RHILI|nr:MULTISPECIES: hypothetical protein [Mesorhizobium]KRB20131.1 hypothetical protein ASE05_24025 [Mesorhizobium sp. Root172]OBQ72725.1 hypothetical protein A8145_08055 [Mesorhizobium loti]